MMSVSEIIIFRIPQLLQTKLLGKYHASREYQLLKVNPSFVPPSYTKQKTESLFRNSPFSFNFPLFNLKVNIQSIKNWRKDFSTGKISPLVYYGNINRQNFDLHGDIKYLAELSRMEFLPFIAFHSITEEKHLQKIQQIISDWNEQNPYLYSIHWTSGIEIAIRSINLVFTHIILGQFNKLSAQLDREIRFQLTLNYHYLTKHLSKFSSANNHLMAELMGLNVLASYFEVPHKQSLKWQNYLEKQVDKQILADGVHMERCTRYHAEVTEQIMISLNFLEASGRSIKSDLKEKLKSMMQFTTHVEYNNDKTIFGDNDEGSVVFPYWQTKFSLYQSQLASANYLYGTAFKNSGEIDFRNYLLFGEDFEAKASSLEEKDTLFKNGGFAFWYDHSQNAKFSFDIGEIGDSLMAAHGHSDIFHFNLMVDKLAFLIDSGTYQYHSNQSFWRNYFRGITAHNTLSVNGKNHALNNGRMSWINRPKVWIDDYKISPTENKCKATTDAFKSEGVMHSREFKWNKKQNELLINDFLTTQNTKIKTIEIYLHFHPSVELYKEGNTILAIRENRKIKLENDSFVNTELVSGNTDYPLGWYSREFGNKKPTSVVKMSFPLKKDLKRTTKITY